MLKIKIIAVGSIKETYFKQAIDEYVKRTLRFASVEICEIPETFFDGVPNEKQIENILRTEGEKILAKTEGFVIAADIGGKDLSSEQLAATLKEQSQNTSTICFVIGGSHGLSPAVKSRANLRWSMGKVTLPHRLFRVVLTEQIYRACCINNNVPYHK